MLWTLAFGGAASIVAAGIYAFAARRVLALGEGHDRPAVRAFATWWLGIALYTLLQALGDLAGAADATPLALFAFVRYATLVLVCVAFGGLAGYVLFVRTGDAAWIGRARVYYALLALAFVALVAASRPAAVVVQRWRTDVALTVAPSAWLFGGALLLAVGPAIAACVSYLRLPRAGMDRAQRRRLLVVGWGMVVTLVAMAVSRASNDDALQLAMRPILGAGVAFAIAREFGGRPPRADDLARLVALERRVRDLV